MQKVVDLNVIRQNKEASKFLKEAIDILSECDTSVFSYKANELKVVDDE